MRRAITGAAFTDTYPAGLVNTAAAGVLSTCAGARSPRRTTAPAWRSPAATIPASGSCTVTVNVTSAAAGAYANTIAVGAVTSTNAGANTAAAQRHAHGALGDLTVAKAFAPGSIGTNDTSVLTITLTNANATAVDGRRVHRYVPGESREHGIGLGRQHLRRRNGDGCQQRHEPRTLRCHGSGERLLHGDGERHERHGRRVPQQHR